MTKFLGSRRKWSARRFRSRRLEFEPLENRRLLAAISMSIEEQLVVEMINRARSDPAAEAARFGIDLNEGLAPGTISPSPKQPLAPNQLLINAARAHSQDMIDRDFFSHTNPDGQNPRDRMVAAGYTPRWWGENIADGYPNEFWFHKALFLSPGHRENILLDNFQEIGAGLIDGEYYSVTGTENFGSRDGNAFFTGVVFSDQIVGDGFLSYDESLGNVTVTAQRDGGGTTYTTTSGPSGGYSLQLPAGVYDLKADGGGLNETIIVSDVYIGSRNVKVDFVVPYIPPNVDKYEMNNTIALATELGYGDQRLEHLTIHDQYDDDYFLWTALQDGQLHVETDLRRDNGDPELILLDTDGNWLQYGTWSENGWSVTWDVEAGQSYVIWVTPNGHPLAIHRDYDVTIDGPGGFVPQPDAFEPNDDFATAADIGQGDRTLTGLTAHVPGDRDAFLWIASASGLVTVEASLETTSEEIQLLLYNSQMQLLDHANETGATRTVSTNVAAGDSLLLLVQAGDRTLIGNYTLRIDGVMPPVAADDRALTEPNTPVEINLLLNDQSDDGELDADTLQLTSSPQHGQVQSVSVDGTIVFSPASDFLGVDRFTYIISDDRGNESASAMVQITVLDPTNKPWQNTHDAYDVNHDTVVSPIDVLFIIDYLNHQGAGPLTVPPTPLSFPPPFYDVNGDNLASPIDVLLVITFLNRRGSDGGEGEAEQHVAVADSSVGLSRPMFGLHVEQPLDPANRTTPMRTDFEATWGGNILLLSSAMDTEPTPELHSDASRPLGQRRDKLLDTAELEFGSDLEALLELLAGELAHARVC